MSNIVVAYCGGGEAHDDYFRKKANIVWVTWSYYIA
jgi:hypothetical protein